MILSRHSVFLLLALILGLSTAAFGQYAQNREAEESER